MYIETICCSFEKLKLDQQELGMSRDHQLDLVWLRESNEKLRKDVLKVIYRHIIIIIIILSYNKLTCTSSFFKIIYIYIQLTSALLVPNTADDLHMTNNNNNNNTSHHLIELIKELASANNKLKTDLLDCSDLLMDCRNELYNKLDKQQEEETMHHDENSIVIQQENNNNAQKQNDDNNNKSNTWLSSSAPQSNEESISIVPRVRKRSSAVSNEIIEPPPPIIEPPTVVHHHYHYYMKNKLMAEKGKLRKSSADTSSSAEVSTV